MSDTPLPPKQNGESEQKKEILPTTPIGGIKEPEATIVIPPIAVPSGSVTPTPNYDFLATPEIAYSNLLDTSKLPAQQAQIIDNQINQFLRQNLNDFFSGADDVVKNAVLPKLSSVDYRNYKNAALYDIIQHEVLDGLNTTVPATNLPAEASNDLPDAINDFINDRLDDAVSDVLYLDDALEDNPIFKDEQRVARVDVYANLAKLDSNALNNLLQKNMDPAITDDETLNEFVQAGDIDATQSSSLNIILELAKLTDNHTILISALIARDIVDTKQLVSMEREDWKYLLQKIEATIFPPEENVDSNATIDQKMYAYIETIYQNIDSAYPSQRFFKRLNDDSTKSDVNLLTSLNTLFQNGQVAIDNKELTDIDWSRVTIENKEQAAADLQKLLEFANTFRQLKADEIINDKTLDANTKITTINNRLNLVNDVVNNNPNMDIQYVDLFNNDGELNWSNIPDDEKPLIRKHLLACQRMMELSDNTDDRHALIKKGFDSAGAVVNYSETDFGNVMGYEPIKAQQHHQKALYSAHRASHYFQTMHDVIKGSFKDLAVSNVDPSLVNNMMEVDGISDLFGPQNYYDCEDCRSILSPAAYFVDMMEFIKEHISRPVFIRAKKTDSSLYLKNRRNDLWNLKLSCDNTDTVIPYLTIVDEVLENYIGNFTQGSVYEMLSTSYNNNSFQLPFNLPLEELRIYLSYFNYTLFDALQLLNSDETTMWREQLKLSQDEFEIVAGTNANHSPFEISRLPGSNTVPVNDTENDTQNISLKGFESIAGITRIEITDLLNSKFNPDIKNIQTENISLNGNAFSYTEVLNNISDDDVDYMHRFIRLAKKTGWAITDLDEILMQLQQAAYIGNTLSDIAILLVAKLHYIKHQLHLGIEQLSAIIYAMPVSDTYPILPEQKDNWKLYENVFDLEDIFGIADANTGALNTTVNLHYYYFNTSNPDDTVPDSITPFILQGLAVTDTELLLLLTLLKTEIGFDINGDAVLDRLKLSLLYRHAKLARKLSLSITDFLYALELLFEQDERVIRSIDQVLLLIKFISQLAKSELDPEEIVFIIYGDDVTNITYTITPDAVYKKVEELAALADADKLDQYKNWLAAQFSASGNMLTNMLEWINADSSDATITTALNAKFTNDIPDDPSVLLPLVSICTQLERVQRLFTKFNFNEVQVDYLTNQYKLFGITDVKNLDINDIFNLAYFKSLINDDEDAEATIEQALSIYQTEQKFTNDAIQLLGKQYNADYNLIHSVVQSIQLSAVPIEAIKYTEQVLNTCQLLGINGHSFKKLVNISDYQSIKAARNVVLGAFSSKYPDEKERDDKLEPYNDKINVAKRDALCAYILANEKVLNFKNKDELYDFFLLDVKMSGCFRTSKLVCALSSLQLYVTRVLANLEPSADGTLSVLGQMSGLKDFKDEWEWRKSYRTWQAGRKVFLYPENYVEPESLDIKSTIFKDLENELMQGKLTKGAAETAYQNYITKFSELARLKICGSFYDDDSNTYYFFGRTRQEPGKLYYRTWQDQSEWTGWQDTDMTINSEHVAAALHLGKLFVFWLDIREDKQNAFDSGKSYVENINYYYTLNYSYLKENGKWNALQKLSYYTYADVFAFTENFSKKLEKEMELAIMNRFRATKLYAENTDSSLIIENFITPVPFPSSVLSKSLDLFKNKVRSIKKPVFKKTYEDALYLFSGSKIDEDFSSLNDDTAFLAIGPQDNSTMAGIDYRVITNTKKRDILKNKTTYYTNDKQPIQPITETFDGLNPYLSIIQGTRGSYYLRIDSQQFLIYGKPAFSGSKKIKTVICLSSSLPDVFGEILFNHGLKQFLSPNTQMKTEAKPVVNLYASKKLRPPYSNPDHVDFNGVYGNYFREIFFHIPFLIANQLNANQKYEDAKWWYERIFDPSAPQTDGLKKDTDRNWRYIEFRNVAIEKMKDALTDKAAIKQYKSNPFNAHAIARLRMGTYQKAIVMKYIDNLLDWGDQLFTEFTMESVNQATMLYMLASGILGKRPVDKGPADIAEEDTLTYDTLASQIEGDSDFLILLENWSKGHENQKEYSQLQIVEHLNNDGAGEIYGRNDINDFSDDDPDPDAMIGQLQQTKPVAVYKVSTYKQTSDVINQKQKINYKPVITKRLPDHQTAKQVCTAFCVPPNEQLLGYWDRVEDRLFKIRHCMNIKGVVKQLALFAPGLNDKLFSKKNMNISFDDMLAVLQKPLPPYRFTYLIEKAKQFTQTVQNLGNTLLNALEKKDIEQLSLLRLRHEKEILNLTTKAKQDALEESKEQLQSLKAQQKNIQIRIDHYSGLIDDGLSASEIIEQDLKITATALDVSAGDGFLISAIEHLVPQIGSPFALKFGGMELGDSATAFAAWFLTSASTFRAVSESAGLLASFERRRQEWEYQLNLANQEMQQMQKQLSIAQIRINIAQRDLKIHEKNIQHNQEVYYFYNNKFSNLGLYKFLSATLKDIYRYAYQIAFDMSLQAEQVYQFETDDDTYYISGDNWQHEFAGLLAGEKLNLQLHRLEKAYIENNKRNYEINQSVSLALLNPQALLQLKQTGACTFTIPEITYDIVYPGQYKRIIKSVRLTIPCVTGPYTNISAKLTLTDSWIRTNNKLNTDPLNLSENSEDEIKTVKNVSISTSSAQNDGGLFELNFRDERYIPFEGAGVISRWNLELPATIRSFNYDTISDIIFHLSYTAKDDGAFRGTIEQNIGSTLTNYAQTIGLLRLFSLKYDFAEAFHKLLYSVDAIQTTRFEVTKNHFPYIFANKELSLVKGTVYLKPLSNETISDGYSIKLNTQIISSWNSFSGDNAIKEGSISLNGSPILTWMIEANGLKKEEIEDVLILIQYKV